MAASDSLRLGALPIRSLAFGSVLVTYVAVGAASTDSSRLLLVQNLTDQTLMFSFDGVTDHFPMHSLSSMIFDLTTNRTRDAAGFYLASGSRIFVRHLGVSPTSGTVYVTYFVGQNN